MIVYDTVAKLHAGGYSLIAYCRLCERHATLDLAGLIASGRGHLGINFRTHCAYCREPGQNYGEATYSRAQPRERLDIATVLARRPFGAARDRLRMLCVRRDAIYLLWDLSSSMNNESVARRPHYIAFRMRDRDRVVAVVANIRHGDDTDPPWAFWHSSLAPWGELKRAPANYRELEIDESTAKRMISLLEAGKPLPDEFGNGLPLLVTSDSPSA